MSHRLQLRDADLDPALNPGSIYFAEQYTVASDDVNHLNSVAHEAASVPAGASAAALGFHAVESHEEAAFNNTPWAASAAGGAATWTTRPFGAGPSNPLRWGTMYNFWFELPRRVLYAVLTSRATYVLRRHPVR